MKGIAKHNLIRGTVEYVSEPTEITNGKSEQRCTFGLVIPQGYTRDGETIEKQSIQFLGTAWDTACVKLQDIEQGDWVEIKQYYFKPFNYIFIPDESMPNGDKEIVREPDHPDGGWTDPWQEIVEDPDSGFRKNNHLVQSVQIEVRNIKVIGDESNVPDSKLKADSDDTDEDMDYGTEFKPTTKPSSNSKSSNSKSAKSRTAKPDQDDVDDANEDDPVAEKAKSRRNRFADVPE